MIYAPRTAIIRKIEDAQERLKLRYDAADPTRRTEMEQVVTDCRAALHVPGHRENAGPEPTASATTQLGPPLNAPQSESPRT